MTDHKAASVCVTALCLWVAGAACGAALPLDLPGNARLEREMVTSLGRYALPTAPYADGFMPTTGHEGEVTAQAWRIEAAHLTTLQLLAPLRDQLLADSFVVIFECDTESCGGFDFRASTTVLPPPEMHVDLGDFRFLAAQRGDEALSLLVSRTSTAGYVQMIRVGQPSGSGQLSANNAPALHSTLDTNRPEPDAAPNAAGTSLPTDFAAALEGQGRIILSDLAFPTGSAQLSPGEFASLRRLADYLIANPDRLVALVGHTDSQGSLDANIALSRRRAGSVLERLVSDYDVPRRQLTAEGMGYLAPIATNLTDAGRDANRRVEVIVTSTE